MTDSDKVDLSTDGTLSRRAVLSASVAGLGALAGCPSDSTDSTTTAPAAGLRPSAVPQAEVQGSHHPGPPRFTSVGEQALGNLLHGDRVEAELRGVDGDLAPFNPVAGISFSWSIIEAPPESSVSLDDQPVVHFEPDVPGTYTLELQAPDGTHELTVQAFPEESTEDPKPRITTGVEQADGQYVITADAQPSPEGANTVDDLDVEFFVDDRDRNSFEGDISVDGHKATIPADAVSDTLRVHAVAVGDRHSVADYVRIEGDGTTSHPNEPPEWIRDATVYEIFVRRFGEDVTFDFLIEKLDYIESLDIDAIWLTPFLKAHSHQNPGGPGGPHGYDITDYFEPTPALGSREDYEAFVDACHERDIKVIFDLVINHTAREHPYFQAGKNGTNVAPQHQQFFHDLYQWRTEDSALAYFGWSGIPVVEYDTLAMRSWILAIVDDWAEVVDGFRCDVAWGVPRSFWKEVRDRIKSRDPEFLLLDETIPWHADFAEDQFGIHFDYGFFETLREIGTGAEPARALHDVLEDRSARGYPDHTAFMNYVENHDEPRYMREADYPAQMAAGAATFTIPGTPMIYYGQETGLNSSRSVMDWDIIDDDLKAFYQSLVDVRQSMPELAADVPFVPARVDGTSEVVGYARETEDSRVLVVLNFDVGTTTVGIPDGVETVDQRTGEDLATEDGRIEVSTVAILRADERLGVGEPLAFWDDPEGDDDGDGTASYPDGVPEGALDCTAFEIQETEDAYQFVWKLANLDATGGSLQHQHLTVYISDDPTGEPTPAPNLDASLAGPADYRLSVDPSGAVLTSADGEALEQLDPRIIGDELRVEVSKERFADIESMAVAPLVAAAGDSGEVAPLDAPSNVVDLVTGPLTDQDDALSPVDGTVTVPYTSVSTGIRNRKLDADLLAAFDDETGDDHGPGEYTYPSSSLVPDGAFDLSGFEVYETDSEYLFRFEFAQELTNPKRAPRSFSLQHLQVYLRDPEADSGGTEAREGLNATLAAPYQYRIAADGYSLTTMEGPDGETVSSDVRIADVPGFDGIWIEVPKEAIGEVTGMEVLPLVAHHDLSATGRIAPIVAEGDIDSFGGARHETAPNVVDLVTPAGVSQSEALAYDEGSRAAMPYLSIEE